MAERESVARFAERIGISREAVYKKIRNRQLTQGSDGLIDVDEGLRQLSQNTHPAHGGDRRPKANPKRKRPVRVIEDDEPEDENGGGFIDLNEARRLHELEKLEERRISNAARRRELIPASEVKATFEAICSAFADRLRAVPMSCAAECKNVAAKGGDLRDFADAVRGEIDAALADFCSAEVVPVEHQDTDAGE